MKRTLLALLVIGTLLSAVVFADTVTVYTEPDSVNVTVGSVVTYTVGFAGTYNGFAFDVRDKDGITVQSLTPAMRDVNADKIGDRLRVSVLPNLGRVDAEKETVATVTVKIDRAGVYTLDVQNHFPSAYPHKCFLRLLRTLSAL